MTQFILVKVGSTRYEVPVADDIRPRDAEGRIRGILPDDGEVVRATGARQ